MAALNINNPHDALFKSFLGDIDIARDFLDIHLPDEIKQQIDLSTLRMVSPAFVESNLKQCFSDLVYSVQYNENADKLYFVLEHLSNAPHLIPFRMLRYQTGVMQGHLDQGHKKLPVIIPLVFYQGTTRPYPGPMQLADCFEGARLAQIGALQFLYFAPLFRLIDVTILPDEQLLTHRRVAVLEWVQKHIRTYDLVELAPEVLVLLARYPLSTERIRQLFHYLIHIGETTNFPKFVELITHSPYQEMMMTPAQYFKEEGRQQGREEGWQQGREEGREEGQAQGREEGREEGQAQGRKQGWEEGKREEALLIAKNMLAKGLDLPLIKEVTDLSDEAIIALMH